MQSQFWTSGLFWTIHSWRRSVSFLRKHFTILFHHVDHEEGGSIACETSDILTTLTLRRSPLTVYAGNSVFQYNFRQINRKAIILFFRWKHPAK